MNQPATILVVDDHAANRDTVIALLESPDFVLIEVENGVEALRLATQSPPDLILLDVMMPGLDGFEVCRRLRAETLTAEVPIIMLTALDDQGSRLRGIVAGADDFVSKPFNRAELRARVRTITRLNRYRRLHEQRGQFQWVVENAATGYVITNHEDEITFANGRARQWLGLPETIPLGQKTFLQTASQVFAGQALELWRNWPADSAQLIHHPRLLVRPETPLSQAFFLEVWVHENTDGRLLRLEDATERLANQSEQRSFQKMVSHKLRTPLNGLQGGLNLLAASEHLDTQDIAELSKMARDSANRLGDAVMDVLRFVELSRPTLDAKGTSFRMIDELVQRNAATLALAPVEVNIAADTLDITLPCAPETLEWILFELLENAKKFHPQGSPAVQVATCRQPKGRVSLTVSDDGCSLSPAQLSRASTPFFQGEKYFSGEVPGMGLGLSSVVAALWQFGGTCHLSNRQPGPGVMVNLTWAIPASPLPPP